MRLAARIVRANLMTVATACALAQAGRAQMPGQPPGQEPAAPVRDFSREIGLDQKLGAQAPLDLMFRDEKGKPARLGSYFNGKPVVMVLVWYKCPGLCPMELQSMVQSFQRVKLEIGKDFNVVTLSINPKETPEIAADRKAQYAGMYGRSGAADGWHFLVGDEPAIRALAASVGYRYVYDARGDQYVHPAGIIVLTPQGRVSRYLFGLDYPPKDLEFALSDASGGRTGSFVQRALILTCFHYDPTTGRYTVAITKVLKLAGVLTVLIIGGFVLLMVRFERRRAQAEAALLASTPLSEAKG